jgi:hypothetical protein
MSHPICITMLYIVSEISQKLGHKTKKKFTYMIHAALSVKTIHAQ